MKALLVIMALVFSISVPAQIITTIAGNGTPGYSGDGGPATNAEFDNPTGVTVDTLGNIYLADNLHDVIHKIDVNGVITVFAGNWMPGYSGDGGPATAAELYLNPGGTGMAVDAANNVYFADGGRVRMVNAAGIITTVAGGISSGYSGDGGPATAAEIGGITGICFDRQGNLYIADFDNSVVRRVNIAGIISTVAGSTIGYSGDGGPATSAQLVWPFGIVCDASGNLFIADGGNFRIRKVDAAGVISTFVGTGPSSMGPDFCDGCLATNIKLIGVNGMATDSFGNIYFSEVGSGSGVGNIDAVFRVTSGRVYVVAGTLTEGYSGDGGPATNAELNEPNFICLDKSGSILIPDTRNYRLRKVWSPATSVPPVNTVAANQLSVYPNPSQGTFTFHLAATENEAVTVTITDLLGSTIKQLNTTTNKETEINLHVAKGMYFVNATSGHRTWVAKVMIE